MKNNHTPEIRFPGFIGDWEEHKLWEGTLKIGDGLHGTPQYSANGNIAFINGNNLVNGKIIINSQTKYVTSDQQSRDDKELNQNTILMSINGTIGNLAWYNGEKVMLGKSAAYIEVSSFDKNFMYQLLQTSNIKSYFLNNLTGSTIKNLGLKTIRETPTLVPKKEEQKRIGQFFKQLDETIAIHQQELTTLKQTKQGFLQNMFPKEGESVPKVRFPGFTGEWEQRKLSDVTKLITKGTTPKDKSGEGDINFIKIENIDSGSGAISVTSKISKEEHEGYLKRSQLELGDILFSIAGTLGRVTIVNDDVLPANTNQALAIIRLNDGNVDFIATYLEGKSVEDYIRKNPTVGAQPNLSLQQVGNLTINYPNHREQEKIGTFFKQLDDTIALYQRELDALQKTKKAFLQKIFV